MSVADNKFDRELKKLNEKLERVQVRRKGNRLYLRATLPPKPNSDRSAPYRQEIATGASANADGLMAAKVKAKEMDTALSGNKFDWEDFGVARRSDRTIEQWLEEYEQNHWATRSQTIASVDTWNCDYRTPFSHLPMDAPLSVEILREKILEVDASKRRQRERFVKAYRGLANFAKLDGKSLSQYIPTQKSKVVNPREIPPR